MKMLTLIVLLSLSVGAFGQNQRIDQYANQPTPAAGDLFLLENAAHTAYENITYGQLSALFQTPLGYSPQFGSVNLTNWSLLSTNALAGATNAILVGPYVDIRAFGAVGDAVTDNTLAVSNANRVAAFSNWWVYIPPGVFSVSNLTLTTSWFGSGTNSVISFNTNCSGICLDCTGSSVSLADFAVFGNNAVDYNVASPAVGNRIGILHETRGLVSVRNMHIYGFNLSGLQLRSPSGVDQLTNVNLYADNWIHHNCFGITNLMGAGEYVRIVNNRLWHNFVGISVYAPNILVADNMVTESYLPAWWAAASGNRGHSKFIGNTFNHASGTLAIIISSNNFGGVLANNSFYSAGNIKIDNCKGINIFGNVADANLGITVDSAGNHLSTGIGFHDNMGVGTLTDNTAGQLIHFNNYRVDGTLVDLLYAGGYGETSNFQFQANSDILVSGVLYPSNGVVSAAGVIGGLGTSNLFAGGPYSKTIVPFMTGYTNGSFIVSASSEPFVPAQAAWVAFSAGVAGQWQGSSQVAWIKVDMGNNRVVREYSLRDSTFPAFMPRTWTFEGSLNNSTWTVLDGRTNIAWSSGQVQYFLSSSFGQYRYYRLNVTTTLNGGGITIGRMQMDDLASPNIQEWHDTSGNILALVDSTAALNIPSAYATNGVWLGTNAFTPAPVLGVWLWNSNQVIFGVSSTKTNVISDLR